MTEPINRLVALRFSTLQKDEFGQFLTRFFKDFDESLISLDDEVSLTLLQEARKALVAYNKSQEQVDLTKSTATLSAADEVRDNNLRALLASIRPYESSHDEQEKTAYQGLSKLFVAYKNTAMLSYEKETARINHLLEQLKDKTIAGYLKLLNADRFVSRLENSQAAFEAIYHNRATGKTFDKAAKTKALRNELSELYQDFADHVAIYARRSSNPAYAQALEVINRTRRNYAEILNKRKGASKKKAVKPTESETPTNQ